MIIISNSPKETKKIGEVLGKKIVPAKEMVFLSLEGNLGTGKTTFLQGLSKGLGVKENITSPTFLIFKKYPAKKKKTFYHFDAYRIKPKDLALLGFDEIIKDKDNVVAVEWSENIKKSIPKKAIKIKFSLLGEKKRKLIVKANNDIIADSCFF